MGKKGKTLATYRKKGDRKEVLARAQNLSSHLDIHDRLHELSLNDFNQLLHSMIRRYNLPYEEVVELLSKTPAKEREISVPVPIFREQQLTHLGSLIKYLKETESLSFQQIAAVLQRDAKAVSKIYMVSCRKKHGSFTICDDDFCVPLSAFNNRSLSILENLTEYLKDTSKLRYNEIARLINRDQRTIWTSYVRAKQKRLTNGF
jgi:hypothetical protein